MFRNCRRLLVYNMGGLITQIGIPQIPLVYVSGEFRNVGLGGDRMYILVRSKITVED